MTNLKSNLLDCAPRHSSLVITGFMGTGKTSVGRMVAQKLGREFVDMDEVIERHEGKTVRAIFAMRGEAYFRARESELCAELAVRENLVIVTGGGALVNVHNRALFANAWIMCLDASVDAIVARLDDTKDRPLLAGGELREQVERLLRARRDAYAQIEHHVDTTNKGVAEVADEILAAFEDSNGPRADAGERGER